MEIPHEDQSSHYDHEKDKFAYLSMRDWIELGKRQVQQSQWGSKYALNGDDSYKHTVGECPTIPTMRDMYGYQSSYTSSWNNHPNLTTQPQPQSSMSTSSLEQAILKISKVMEDFVGEQQKINSHLNEKIDNLESSINVRMEGVYNDLSLRIEKVQDSIEKLTNLDIAMRKRKLPPQPHHNLQGTNAKRSRKVLMIDTLVGDCYDNFMDQPSIENHKKRIPWTKWEGCQFCLGSGEFNMKWVCEKTRKTGRKTKSQPFSHNTSVINFRITHPLCENAFHSTLCYAKFAFHLVLCEIRITPPLVRIFLTTLPLCQFLSFFIPTLPNPKPLSLVLSCSKALKWYIECRKWTSGSAPKVPKKTAAAVLLLQKCEGRLQLCPLFSLPCFPLLHCSFLAYFERLRQRTMRLQSLVFHEFELPKALP
ncbi:hypothetical protein AAG906_041169 [Vitis piasezkii]